MLTILADSPCAGPEKVMVNELMRASVESMNLGGGADVAAHPVELQDSSADSSGVSTDDEESSAEDDSPAKVTHTEVRGISAKCTPLTYGPAG